MDSLPLACSGNSTAHRVSLGSSELTQSERFPPADNLIARSTILRVVLKADLYGRYLARG